jgi:hypothetical protein
MSLGLEGAAEANNRLSRIAAGRADVQAVDSRTVERPLTEGGRKEGMHAAEAHTSYAHGHVRIWVAMLLWSYRLTG